MFARQHQGQWIRRRFTAKPQKLLRLLFLASSDFLQAEVYNAKTGVCHQAWTSLDS